MLNKYQTLNSFIEAVKTIELGSSVEIAYNTLSNFDNIEYITVLADEFREYIAEQTLSHNEKNNTGLLLEWGIARMALKNLKEHKHVPYGGPRREIAKLRASLAKVA